MNKPTNGHSGGPSKDPRNNSPSKKTDNNSGRKHLEWDVVKPLIAARLALFD